MKSRKRLMSTTAVLVLTLALLATGGLTSLPATGADSVPVETEPASSSIEDEARVDVDPPVLMPPIAEQAGEGYPCASEDAASPGTSLWEIDAILADRPVLLFFYADWCHYCHEQMPIIDELEQEYAGRLGFLRINVDERPDYSEQFDVSALPTMFIVTDKEDGQYVKQQILGFVDKKTLRQGLDYVIQNGSLPEEGIGYTDEPPDSDDDIDTYSGNSESLPCSPVGTPQEFTFTFEKEGRIVKSDSRIFCRAPDEDQDGIYDVWENEAAYQLRPYVALDEDENWLDSDDTVVALVRVTPISDGQTEYILFFYVVTWSTDYGRYSEFLTGHPGDTERIVMAWQVLDDHTIQLKYVYTAAHEGESNDHGGVWSPYEYVCHYMPICQGDNQLLCANLKFMDNRLVVRASEDKHATYPTTGVCEETVLVNLPWPTPDVGEDCGGGGTLGWDYPLPVCNVGEPWYHLIDELSGSWYGEAVWSASEFCGGWIVPVGTHCAGSVESKLEAPPRLLTEMGFYGTDYDEGHYCYWPVHNHDTGEGFDTIQGAIDSASPDDTIIVLFFDTHVENVNVTKPVTIRSLWANPDYCVVKAADPSDHVFEVTSDGVNISGFTVTGATGIDAAGIYLHEVAHCNITHNIASNNYRGISMYDSSDNELSDNTANSNTGDGIYLRSSGHNTLSENGAESNGATGIWLDSSGHNTVTGNSAHDNTDHGIYLEMSDWNDILDNTTGHNNWGIMLEFSMHNSMTDNLAYSNVYGVYLKDTWVNNLTDNEAWGNDVGIAMFTATGDTLSGNKWHLNDCGMRLDDSNGNIITGEVVSRNAYGIHLHESRNNLIYNNWFDNSINAWDDASNGTNTWNITKRDGPNIALGPYLGGNYWSDYGGDDTDSPLDGLGNTLTPYDSSGDIAKGGDELPLLPWIENIDTGHAYGSIGQAVYESYPGQTITLGPGIYRENVVVPEGKSVTITGISGNPDDTIVWAATNDTHVFDVRANDVTISNLSICGATGGSFYQGTDCAGIYLAPGTGHCNLENNRSGWDANHRNYWGIRVDSSDNNIMVGNNCRDGIRVGYSENNTILSNNCSHIRLDSSNCTTILGNDCSDGIGIGLVYSNENTVSENTCLNGAGIGLHGCQWNVISDNVCSGANDGIDLWDSSHNQILDNTCSDTYRQGEPYRNGGIVIAWGSPWNTIRGNTCLDNENGIWLEDSSQNTIYLNDFINNGANVYSEDSINNWISPNPITYLYDEWSCTNYLGNHWSDYEERYPDAEGTEGAHVWDTPYEIPGDAGDGDNYPLVSPSEDYEIGSNNPPNTPSNLSPVDHAAGVSVNTYLTWTGGDPDSDDVVDYDVHLGTSEIPPLWESIGPYPAGQSFITYDPGTLSGGTTYYWQIVTRGMYGESRDGPVSNFTTVETGDVANLEGHVSLQGRPAAPHASWIASLTVTFLQGGVAVRTENVMTDNAGNFTIADVAVGTYDICVKSARALSEAETGVVIVSGTPTSVDFDALREGDANDDDAISLADYALLYAAYGSAPGDGNWNDDCDFNRNEAVELGDYALLYSNYGQVGDCYAA
jgi:parallel beta-helix repeat protein